MGTVIEYLLVRFTILVDTLFIRLSLTKKKLTDKVEQSMTFLTSFAATFSWANARVLFIKGWHSFVQGNFKRSEEFWSKGVEEAKKYQMVYEEALIEFQRGVCFRQENLISKACKRVPEVKSRMYNIDHITLNRSIQSKIFSVEE